jgi:hypothetical protein
MKKIILSIALLFTFILLSHGQMRDPLVSQCILNAGEDAKYLKDFRIQLGTTENQADMRYKAKMSLWRNTKYRFSMCNTDSSKGRLILTIKDESDKTVLSSYDKKTGKIYPYIDFTCNKSGIYQICYDFENRQQGSGVGVVSMIR